ncbi:MAG: MMPL family transporter [Proteobacteria bacterium]|nr:MMPL family transporter [Pseudomonadota bacterium]
MTSEHKKTIWLKLVEFHVGHPVLMLILIVLGTLFFGYNCLNLRIHTDFFDLYPPKHEYIKLYKQYRNMFGTANVMTMVLEVKKGDIYNVETIKKVDLITQEIMAVKGVDNLQIISLTHPRLKNIGVGASGLRISPIVKVLPETPEELRSLKERVYTNEGVRGVYVSPDDKAALISAGFWEEGLDLDYLFKEMQKIKSKVDDSNHTLYITGYPMLYAWIAHYVPQLYNVFIVTAVVMLIMLWWYFRSFMGVFIPMISAVVSAIWGLGFAATLGINIDPLVLVIPLLLSARALSHSVQSMERYHEEYATIGEQKKAIISAYGYLYKPGILGLITDGLGVLTIAVASIPLMRNLAIYGSFWIISIYVSSIVMHPVLVSLLPPPRAKHLKKDQLAALDKDAAREKLREITARPGDKIYIKIGEFFISLTQGFRKWIVLALVIIVIFGGGYLTQKHLKVGDTSAGKAILYSDHPYNIAADIVNKDFIGASQMVVVAEGTENKEGSIADAATVRVINELGIYARDNIPAVGGAITISDMIKTVFRMFHDGHPKWAMLPEKPLDVEQVLRLISGSTSGGEMDRYVSFDYTNATIILYFREYNNQVIKDAIATLKQYIDDNPVDKIKFRLAGGILGILAAVNEEVEWSYWINMALIFGFTFLFCTIAYRTFWGALVLFIPLLLSQVLSDLLMLGLGIDMNINSLPVASVGVGIGVDYGIYILSRLSEEYQFSNGDYKKARYLAITTTGKAIIFTASTLVVSVIFFAFASFKFQAEMAILLAFLLVANMVGALTVLPALVSIVGPEKILPKYRA